MIVWGKLFIIVTSLALSLAFAAQTAKIGKAGNYMYLCQGGKSIAVTYLTFKATGPNFAILDWKGEHYGLAEAPSGSGTRYAGLYGPTAAGNGLEWWEAQGSATLSTFTSSDVSEMRPLLRNCKVQTAKE